MIFTKILKGIKACHEANVYHRDIKLENILLNDNYNPKICDFGLGILKQKKAIEPVGTLKYAAPEVLANKLYDSSKIDIFILGVTLFYLVNSSTGFNKATESDVAFIGMNLQKLEKELDYQKNLKNYILKWYHLILKIGQVLMKY